MLMTGGCFRVSGVLHGCRIDLRAWAWADGTIPWPAVRLPILTVLVPSFRFNQILHLGFYKVKRGNCNGDYRYGREQNHQQIPSDR